MDAQWIMSPTGRRVIGHWADPRPTWLWSGDGQTLIWRNLTARLFHKGGKAKGLRADREIVPIRGQIARLIRLGSPHRSSLSRMQFLDGERPVSATCSCTPVGLADGSTGLLVIDVDPIGADLIDGPLAADATVESLLPRGADYILFDDDMQIAGGSPWALQSYAPWIALHGFPDFGQDQTASVEIDARQVGVTQFSASPLEASLLLFEAAGVPAAASQPTRNPSPPAEPLLPLGLPPIEPSAPAAIHADEPWAEPLGETAMGGLSSLFDRLRDDGALFEPLRPDEDFVAPVPAVDPGVTAPPSDSTVAGETLGPHNADSPPPATPPQEADLVPTGATAAPVEGAGKPLLYRVVGRSFTPMAASDAAGTDVPVTATDTTDLARPDMPATALVDAPLADVAAALAAVPSAPPLADDFVAPPAMTPAPETPAPTDTPDGASGLGDTTIEQLIAAAGIELPQHSILPPSAAEGAPSPTPDGPAPAPATGDGDAVDRVSRYNFDELSRILNDRVGKPDGTTESSQPVARRSLPGVPSATPEGELVTLSGETLVLNRLPLGILVFRDQQVLFANRAITEMVGYESVESLRQAGLAAIFPAANGEAAEAGPVNHLTQRNGTLVPVTARLQSVSWQGKAALMLSASTTEVRTGHEAAVRAFAELLASTRADGFIEANRAGVLTTVSATARTLVGPADYQWLGRPLSLLIDPGDAASLRDFLERPARFAETARPAVILRGANPDVDVTLFAQGQAGLVSGYFGYVRERAGARTPALAAPQSEADTGLLARLSRGLRRPLNTVIGFSDLIGSAAFGPVENERYLEYARDIKTAGLEIAALVDELDDFARLRDGRYTARPADIDLAGLLESSAVRVRGQASLARVLVRTAISETLPRVRADRASLAQAVLNLLASAIDQTPAGGSVVLSAQVDDAGGIAVNVRDSAAALTDPGERFVVFRDGIGRDGEVLTPVRSSVGLALTRALLAVNASSLSVDPAGSTGTLFSLVIPPENVVMARDLPPPAKP